MSSEGGLLALREIEARLGVAGRLAACLRDLRAPERIRHGVAEMLRFRLLMIAAAYEDGNDADSLRHDPVFKLANGRLPDDGALCSQPTLSRLENTPDRGADQRGHQITQPVRPVSSRPSRQQAPPSPGRPGYGSGGVVSSWYLLFTESCRSQAKNTLIPDVQISRAGSTRVGTRIPSKLRRS